jgi:hypothetical protein
MISVDNLKTPGIVGMTIRVQPVWPRRFAAECSSRAIQAHDDFTLLIMGGFSQLPTSDCNIAYRVNIINAYADDFLRNADRNYLAAVHLPTVTPYGGASEELYCGNPIPKPFFDANRVMIDATLAAFPRQTMMMALTGQDVASQLKLVQYALKKAPGRILCKINSLGPQTTMTAPQVKLLIQACQLGAMLGFEFRGPLSSADFAKAVAIGRKIGAKAGRDVMYWGTYPGNLKDVRA